MDIEKFEAAIRAARLSANTKSSYLFSAKQFQKKYGTISRVNLDAYKAWLIDSFSVKTANIRILALNWYVKNVLKKPNLVTPLLKVQQKPFLENVIS